MSTIPQPHLAPLHAPPHLRVARARSSTEPGEAALARARQIAEVEGPSVLGDDELLALVLGRGGDGLGPLAFARILIEQLGGLAHLAKTPAAGLHPRPGLGRVQATRLSAAFELGRRAAQDAARLTPQTPLTKERVVEWAAPRLVPLEHEEVWVLSVDARSSIKSTWQVGRGGVHGCGLVARDILTPIVRDAASGFVLVHNHPSGDPTPSQEDVDLTLSLSAAATTICVPLLDHVVVARGGARSFMEIGLLS